MPMILSPYFLEWLNIWLIYFLKELYNEIKMVVLRGNDISLNNYTHTCLNNGSHAQQSTHDVVQSLQTSLNIPQTAAAHHIGANQINLQPLNNVAIQLIPQQNNTIQLKHDPFKHDYMKQDHVKSEQYVKPDYFKLGPFKHDSSKTDSFKNNTLKHQTLKHDHFKHDHVKHDHSSSRYSSSKCMLPSHHFTIITQTRPVEYYHPTGAAGGAYMPSTSGGAQASGQASLRVQPTQPSAPPTPQQDMSKTSMAGHSYVPQNQTAPPRSQYTNFPYRPSQHTMRPTTLPRQQQSYISGAATSTGPVMFPILLPPIPLSVQTYSQPRSNTQYYQYHPYVTGYNNSSSGHTPQYYYSSNSPQLPTPNPQTNTSGRSNPTTMVGPQGTTTTPTAPTASIPHQQPPTHMHHTIPGIRNTLQKRTHRLPIIDPETQQDILSDLYSNDSYNDSSNRQTPQPEPSHSIAEEFTRRVNEVANQHSSDIATKWNYGTTNADATISSTSNIIQTQPNAIISNNNNNKSEILTINDCKSLGPDIAIETNETPIVSAISDSPVIVPKMPLNVKQFQKNSDQPLVIESNKSFTHNKQLKSKNVPQIEDVETCSEDILIVPASAVTTNQETPASTPITSSTQINISTNTQVPAFNPVPAPQPQRIREPRDKTNDKKEEKIKIQDATKETETSINTSIPNGPVPPVAISSLDSLSNAINPLTSQSHHSVNTKSTSNLQSRKHSVPAPETIAITEATFDVVVNNEQCVVSDPVLTPTELLSASIEKVVKEQQQQQQPQSIPETREVSSASEAQAKLTQSLSSVLRSNQTELTMKDINLNNKSTDPDTANGNNIDLNKTEDTTKDDVNKNEIPLKNPSSINSTKITNDNVNEQVTESYENGNETDKVDNVEQHKPLPAEEDVDATTTTPEKSETSTMSPIFVPKYKYSDDQWSPINRQGKKSYGIGLLKQIKDDPMSKNRPLIPSLEMCNVLRTSPMQESVHIPNVARSINDSLFPTFAKGSGMGPRNNTPRDPKKDGRNVVMPGRGGSMKMAAPSGGSSHKPVIHVRLHDDVKLNEVDSAWKPTRFRQENIDEEELKTQELYKKFRGILNKLTPQKFDTLLDRIKTLEIDNQKRLEGVIDLVFEKAIDEPNFSEAYAAMCNKLSKLKVPADNASSPDQCVNFRALIINKCQNQFETDKVDSHVVKLEKDYAECTDPVKKKEILLMMDEEQRRIRMRSVGNVRFIGELYKLKMLTSKIMEYCMKQLIDKIEEEKLECLCKLLTTIGEQIENEVSGQLDNIFKKMQEIVDRKSNKISSRVRFMIQDVIELRKRKWYVKSVIDSQPKMMDQIQKEAEQQQRHIELMNASPGGGFRRDDGGRGKRGDGRRQNSNNSFNDAWKPPRTTNFPVDTTKLKAVTQKNLRDIKLAPHNSAWNQGSSTKNTAQNAGSSNSMISISKNMYSMLENVQTDPTSLRGTRDMTPSYHSKGASIERSTFNSRASDSSRSGSMTVPRSNSGTRSASVSLPNPAATTEPQPAPSDNVPAEPLPPESNCLMVLIKKFMISCVVEEFVSNIVDQAFPVQYHVAVIKEIFNITLDYAPKKFDLVARSFENLITSKVFSPENFLAGLQETLELSSELFIDIPMLYENLGNLIAPHIAKKHITFADIHKYSDNMISSNHGHMFLKATFRHIKEKDGTAVAKSRWQESGMLLKQWMDESQIPKWMSDNNLEYLEENSKLEVKLLQLMKADESYDHIKGWVKENIGKSSNEDWFMRSLIQAICEYALIGPDGREMPHINPDRMNKYARLIHEFGETKQSREASCLFGIQQLIRKREYPQGLALDIFQHLHEQYIISLDGFIEWEKSEKEPEGKAVMLKMLTSFFTNIKEAYNEDSCSEE